TATSESGRRSSGWKLPGIRHLLRSRLSRSGNRNPENPHRESRRAMSCPTVRLCGTGRPRASGRLGRRRLHSGPRIHPRLEWMEDRTLLSTFTVTNRDDSGTGSLRQAILDSNAALGATNTIDFDIPGGGVQTIAPLSPLPAI